MTFQNPFSARARRKAKPAHRDRSFVVIILMMAVVFVPLVGLHVAFASFGPGAPAAAVSSMSKGVTTDTTVPKRSRG